MLNQFNQMISEKSYLYNNIFMNEITMKINFNKKLSSIDDVANYFDSIKNSIKNVQLKVDAIKITTDEITVFDWRLSGIHIGVFNGFLPTNKPIDLTGLCVLKLNHGFIQTIDWFFDQTQFENDLFNSKETIINEKDVFNDLSGEANKIYNLLLSTRKNMTDSKHPLLFALRRESFVAPDFSLLNSTHISQIKKATAMQRKFIPTPEEHQIEIFIYTPIERQDDPDLPTVLYLHGGGWCIGSPEGYDLMNRQLAYSSNVRVVCPRYRLAPENPYPAGLNDCCWVYQWLREKIEFDDVRWNNEKIIVAGDSVGGGFAAALILKMKQEEYCLPDAAMFFSPATDMRLENYHSYNHYTKNNIMIDQAFIGFIRGVYTQGHQWDDPYISPMRGDMSNFPPSFIMIGEEDPLYDENQTFSAKISRESGKDCVKVIGKGMPHHYHTFIGLSPEVDKVYEEVDKFIKSI